MVENVIPRKYNYQLETGTVGTDDDDMANILYNINRMEMKADFEDGEINAVRLNFGQAYSLAIDAAQYLYGFIEKHNEKLNPATVGEAQSLLNGAIVALNDLKPPQTDIKLMRAAVKDAYQKMLNAVPFLVLLDEQSL